MSYGIINIEGRKYVERPQYFSEDVVVTVGLAILANQRVVMPGVSGFLLKGLARQVIAAAAPAVRAFRFKFGNTDGGIWYVSSGIGGVNERVLDTTIFGNGPFPMTIVPHIFYGRNANIPYEIEDVSNNVPYTIHITFIGSYLIPVD